MEGSTKKFVIAPVASLIRWWPSSYYSSEAKALVSLFRSRAKLRHEILILRHQLNVLRRTSPERGALTNIERLLLVWSCRVWPDITKIASD
jgi:hypothetical protein